MCRCEFCKQQCEKSFLAPQILYGCLWCQHVAHADCLFKCLKTAQRKPGRDGPYCALGQSRKVILPPSYIREIAPSVPRFSSHEGASTSDGRMLPPESPLKKAVNKAKEFQASLRKRARRSKHLRTASHEEMRSLYNSEGNLVSLEGRQDTRPVNSRYELILPLPSDCSPLIVFVNLKAGPQEGDLVNQCAPPFFV